jgi:hypothetical protein
MNQLQTLFRDFYDFCQATSIHGLRYFGDPSRGNVIRAFWLIITVISFVYAGCSIQLAVQGKVKIEKVRLGFKVMLD